MSTISIGGWAATQSQDAADPRGIRELARAGGTGGPACDSESQWGKGTRTETRKCPSARRHNRALNTTEAGRCPMMSARGYKLYLISWSVVWSRRQTLSWLSLKDRSKRTYFGL